MKTFDQIVGEQLKKKRNQLKKSQEQIEEAASLSERYLGKIERGKVSPEF
ncbi:helix-turn-helix domain-containing protein [Oceanobacillus salinisoli]|nr:helix-turn-helix transcriptional regulator [Oceanobacillus salinisoli]